MGVSHTSCGPGGFAGRFLLFRHLRDTPRNSFSHEPSSGSKSNNKTDRNLRRNVLQCTPVTCAAPTTHFRETCILSRVAFHGGLQRGRGAEQWQPTPAREYNARDALSHRKGSHATALQLLVVRTAKTHIGCDAHRRTPADTRSTTTGCWALSAFTHTPRSSGESDRSS